MLKTGLEFASGTTEDSKRLVARLFSPGDILGAYRAARQQFKTGDLVLEVSEQDPSGFKATPRAEYLKHLRHILGAHAPKIMSTLGIANRSAHGVVQLPFESDAMWLIVLRGSDLPCMCVIFAVPYSVASGAN